MAGQETTIIVNNSGVSNARLVLGSREYYLVADGTAPGGWVGSTYYVALNGTTTLPIPAEALGATSGSLTDLGTPDTENMVTIE